MESRTHPGISQMWALNPAAEGRLRGESSQTESGNPKPRVPRRPFAVPSQKTQTPAKGQTLPTSDTHTAAAFDILFCFSLTSDSAGKNTQALRSEHPRPGSTCIEGAGSQARTKKEPAYAYSRAPRDPVGFPQWAVGHVPTKAPQGCVLWKGRPGGASWSGTPRRMVP